MTEITDVNFLDTDGNEVVKKQLKQLIQQQKLARAVLLVSTEPANSATFAQNLAQDLCKQKLKKNHPDIHSYFPEGKLAIHTISSMKKLVQDMSLPAYYSHKVYIIYASDRMNKEAANALLKTLEEPAENSTLILTASDKSKILPTILSRTIVFNLKSVSSESVFNCLLKDPQDFTQEQLKTAANLCGGSLEKALLFLSPSMQTIKKILAEFFNQKDFFSYLKISEVIQAVNEIVEKEKKAAEKIAKKENLEEKELEGYVSVKLENLYIDILNLILSWQRDLCVKQLSGLDHYIINQDYKLDSTGKNNIDCLEKAGAKILQAKRYLKTNTSFASILENLLLEL